MNLPTSFNPIHRSREIAVSFRGEVGSDPRMDRSTGGVAVPLVVGVEEETARNSAYDAATEDVGFKS